MRTAHFAFCVCILSVLQPLQAFRGNKESHVEPASLVEFEAANLPPSKANGIKEVKQQLTELKLEDDRKANEIKEVKQQLTESKLEDDRKANEIKEVKQQLIESKLEDDRKAKEITDLKEEIKEVVRNEIKEISERVDALEGNTDPVQQMARDLTQKFNSAGDKEAFWKEYSVTSLCSASKSSLCTKSPDGFEEALKNPCMEPGCVDQKASAEGKCRSEKYYFLRWSEVFCMHLHRDQGSNVVLGCIEGAINLLNSTDGTKFNSGEWGKSPAGKHSVIFWSRIPESMWTKIRKIPHGFLLSSTLLGALTRMPGVQDLESCTWDCQKDMWASNSKGLINQMHKQKPEYFVTGMNVLQEVERPFVETVAFQIELPALAAAPNLGELYLASLHQEMTCDDLTMAIKMSFGHESEKKIHLRCARCHHCLNMTSSESCFTDCITDGTAVRETLTVNRLLLKNGRAQKAVRVGLATVKDLVKVWKLTPNEVKQAGFSKEELEEGGFVAKEIREVSEAASTYQEALDMVYGMPNDEALAFLKKSRNPYCKEVVADLEQLDTKAKKFAEALFRKGPDSSSLRWAAQEGWHKVVELLLEWGAHVEAKDKDGRTPLHLAAIYGHDKVVGSLLRKGANVEAKDKDGFTPLQYAAWLGPLGHHKVVKLLLQCGAKTEVKNKYGETPLHWAAFEGHDKVVELLLRRGANVEAKDSDGNTPLDWATKNGHDNLVKLLKDEGPKPMVTDNLKKQQEPQEPGVAGCLVEQEAADVGPDSSKEMENEAKDIALKHKAMNKIAKPSLKQLWEEKAALKELNKALSQQSVDKVTKCLDRCSSIGLSADKLRPAKKWLEERRREEAAKKAQAAADERAMWPYRNRWGERYGPIVKAAEDGDLRAVRGFVRHSRSNLWKTDLWGCTALHRAVWKGHMDIVEWLVSAGANVNAKTDAGTTPLDWAKEEGHTAIANFLEEHGGRRRWEV